MPKSEPCMDCGRPTTNRITYAGVKVGLPKCVQCVARDAKYKKSKGKK